MPRPLLVFLHSSDELYGADRMLLEMVAAVPGTIDVQVWLPDDLAHPANPLCAELERRGVAVRHTTLPVLRRAYANPKGLLRLAGRGGVLLRNLLRARPSAVYCTTSAVFPCAPLARMAGVRRVFGHVQEILGASDRALLGPSAACCTRLLAISGAVADSVPTRLRSRTVVVPNGTPEPAALPSPPAGDGAPTFLVASRWNGWKGHGTLLRAWQLAGEPGTLLVLGGPPPSGESVDVPALVSELGIDGSVRVLGEVPDPDAVFALADVVLMPSDQPEPFGLVAIEAFARGRPVVASAAGGLAEIVTHGVDGWTFPPKDVAALAGVLAGVDGPQIVAAGERARESYLQRWTAAGFAERWRRAVFG